MRPVVAVFPVLISLAAPAAAGEGGTGPSALVAEPAPAAAETASAEAGAAGTAAPGPPPADAVAAALADPGARDLVTEVLRRNPGLAAAAARARAAERAAPQARALPDPMAMTTVFLQRPETRVGPQEVMVGLTQSFPWFGKLGLRERVALYEAAAARAELEARRLEAVTEARRLLHELAFLTAREEIVRLDRATLEHYEELARTRYAAGVGLQQAVVKIQAEIAQDDVRLLDLADRRASQTAAFNALRDLPPDTPVPAVEPPAARPTRLEIGAEGIGAGRPAAGARARSALLNKDLLRAHALAARPELAAAAAEIGRAEALEALAAKGYRPDVTLGLTYTRVGLRDDPAARANPPADNGQDILGLNAAVNLPVRRAKLAAAVEEAAETRRAAGEARRAVVAGIDRALGELTARIPLTEGQLRLFDGVLTVQAEESLRSAEAGYAAGSLDALDLLDAERVLLEVRTAAARTRADFAIALAELEGVVAGPLAPPASHGESLP